MAQTGPVHLMRREKYKSDHKIKPNMEIFHFSCVVIQGTHEQTGYKLLLFAKKSFRQRKLKYVFLHDDVT